MPENAGRPPEHRRASPTTTPTLSADRHAELALRIAWLRVHAEQMYDVDERGLLSAQLLDLADLLEALDRDGRVIW